MQDLTKAPLPDELLSDAARAALERVARDGYFQLNRLHLAGLSPDRAALYVDLEPALRNPYGVAHGGLLFTLCDFCAGLAAGTDGGRYVTQNASYYFMKNVSDGRLTATGQVLSRGRRVCVVRCQVQDAAGTPLTEGTFSMYRIGPVGERPAADPDPKPR